MDRPVTAHGQFRLSDQLQRRKCTYPDSVGHAIVLPAPSLRCTSQTTLLFGIEDWMVQNFESIAVCHNHPMCAGPLANAHVPRRCGIKLSGRRRAP